MSATAPRRSAAPALEGSLAEDDVKSCCAALYEHPGVRWLLGGELHPGGETTTRRSLELIGAKPGERLLDVGSGTGSSALVAAREFGCVVAGVDYGPAAVRDAQQAAEAEGLCDQVGFVVGDAESLPFREGEFDAVLCECSLSTFPDKRRALAEMRRVLRPGGRLGLSDVVVDPKPLPSALGTALAAIACVGEALPRAGYEDMLRDAGLRPYAVESRDSEAAALAERVHERLRGARLIAAGAGATALARPEAIELARLAMEAIADGALGYAIFAAEAPIA
ncbi:MAG: class I SAM-dependent methyltransferase [Solirubrobacterales bacterium]